MSIHRAAIVDPKSEIDSGVEIGPYVVIEGQVKIKRGTRVMAHAYLTGCTEIGEDNEIHPGAVLGGAPQDVAYKGQETYLRIGNNNIIREHVQIHRGTAAGSSTLIGDNNFLMATAHVGHNCRLGSNVVHQFVRIGAYALMRGLSGTSRDVPPFAIIDWQHTVRGVNVVGLKRAGFDAPRIRQIREAFRILFRKERNLALAVKEVEASNKASQDVVALLDFIKTSKRGVCFGASGSRL